MLIENPNLQIRKMDRTYPFIWC